AAHSAAASGGVADGGRERVGEEELGVGLHPGHPLHHLGGIYRTSPPSSSPNLLFAHGAPPGPADHGSLPGQTAMSGTSQPGPTAAALGATKTVAAPSRAL